MEKISIYIHIPFCESKCKYCDFTSLKGNDEMKKDYMEALIKELKLYSDIVFGKKIDTIFIGGGTPSSIDYKYIGFLFDILHKYYDMGSVREITLETNPGTIDIEKARAYKSFGIDRISMGAQSFNDQILKVIGRIHTERDIFKTIDYFRTVGINNLNLDLMFSLPNQSLEDIVLSLEKAIDLDINHISNYSLILEQGTVLYDEYKKGKFDYIKEDLDRKMYQISNEILVKNGYNHYEISNFAKEGFECKHNLVYWDIKPYLGFGVSSHSNFGNERFSNINNITKYIKDLKLGNYPIENREIISETEEMAEYAIMGFRKIEGINTIDFQNRFKMNFYEYFESEIDKNLKAGLIQNVNNFINLTKKGLDLSNQVELDFYKI